MLPTVESSMSKTLRHKIKGLDTCASNIYGVPECILLTWLNHHYEERYPILFPDSGKQPYHLNSGKITLCTTETSEQRYVKSFDVDLMDSMVLACVITAYIPYLVSPSHTLLYGHIHSVIGIDLFSRVVSISYFSRTVFTQRYYIDQSNETHWIRL